MGAPDFALDGIGRHGRAGAGGVGRTGGEGLRRSRVGNVREKGLSGTHMSVCLEGES